MFDYSGQWLGESSGTLVGKVLLDVEVVDGVNHAVGYYFPRQAGIPASILEFQIGDEGEEFTVESDVSAFDPVSGRLFRPDRIKEVFPHLLHPGRVAFSVRRMNPNSIQVEWNSAVEPEGKMELKRSILGPVSRVEAPDGVLNWGEFREKVSGLDFGVLVFRGQSRPWPLQTSFHRTRRKILHTFMLGDIPRLHRSLTGVTNHLFDLDRPQQLGAFLNLAQHHGFPTPLLDWTYSPFVAAWFAFSDAVEKRSDNDHDGPVRIFTLNKTVFSKLNQFQHVAFAPPHFSILEALAIENNRAIPQQGLLTLTNVHDIEEYLEDLENENNDEYLSAYDIKRADARSALNDLAMMGITRSTLFPGIENICRELKERHF